MMFTQALACGLPIIGITTSGAPDLSELLGLEAPRVQALPVDSATGLEFALQATLSWARLH